MSVIIKIVCTSLRQPSPRTRTIEVLMGFRHLTRGNGVCRIKWHGNVIS